MSSLEQHLVITSPPTVEGVVTLTLNNPRKLNSLSGEMMEAMRVALLAAGADDQCKAAILTGTGRYYTAGADFNGLIKPMWPSSLVKIAKERNENLFLMFIDFPKPLIVAINGPTVGAGVTSSACCDYVLSVPEATFWTPFKSLGITPEGCSSVTFPERYGKEFSIKMLENGEKTTAAYCHSVGFVDEIVDGGHTALLERAHEVANEWVAANKSRPSIASGEVARLRMINKKEAVDLANALISKPFVEALMVNAQNRKQTGMAWAFWFVGMLQPVWSKL